MHELESGRVTRPWNNVLQHLWHLTLLLGLGPLFLCGLGASWASEPVLPRLGDAPFTAAAAAASAAAFNRAMVWDFGRRPRTPFRTGRGGKGLGSRYDVCMDEEELAEERRVVREAEVEDTGARRAPGRVTGEKWGVEKKNMMNNVKRPLWIYPLGTAQNFIRHFAQLHFLCPHGGFKQRSVQRIILAAGRLEEAPFALLEILHFNTPWRSYNGRKWITAYSWRELCLEFSGSSGIGRYIAPPSIEIGVKSHNRPETCLLDDSSNPLLPETLLTQWVPHTALDIGFLGLMSNGSREDKYKSNIIFLTKIIGILFFY